ncbi:MAG: hypothetical protein H5T33_01890 [Candidatus Methanosuratus sp.]|nr:hypothetical protein [Candidatus Methanosuratincola sp.]
MLYRILLCRKCGQPCASQEGSKTFTCAYCGSRNEASRSVRIFEHLDSKDVPAVLAKLKSARASKHASTKTD